jgi:hypothetical protein
VIGEGDRSLSSVSVLFRPSSSPLGLTVSFYFGPVSICFSVCYWFGFLVLVCFVLIVQFVLLERFVVDWLHRLVVDDDVGLC